MSQLVCENISKQYKKKEVLHDINLTIEQGKIYGLVGRNGAGKTTTLHAISNIIKNCIDHSKENSKWLYIIYFF